jgi:hypothetical protein
MSGNEIRKEKSPQELEAMQSAQQPDTLEIDESKLVDRRQLDDAAQYLAGHDDFGPLTPEKEKAIVRKIDAWMIPLVKIFLPGTYLPRIANTKYPTSYCLPPPLEQWTK